MPRLVTPPRHAPRRKARPDAPCRWAARLPPLGVAGLFAAAVLASAVVLASAGGAPVELIGTTPPGRLVYGEARYPLSFEHAAHAERSDCATCHAGVAESTAAAEAFWPSMAVCATCHPQADDTETPGACAHCHPGYRPLWPEPGGLLGVRDPRFPLSAPPRAVRPARHVRFSHRAHAAVACADCHSPQVRGGASLPAERTCLDCHAATGAATECAACHATQRDGRLLTRLQANAVAPPAVLRPRDHDRDWAIGHALAVSAGGDAQCAVCHAAADCMTCHDGVLGFDSPHAPGFTFEHSFEARRDASACATCHTASTFCVDCHVDANVSTGETARPPLGAELHPAGWLAPGGGTHALEAQRSLLECASCHVESDCAQCHAFINPHGAGFFERCETLLRANPRLCARCHDDPARLRALCD
jgi:hypothetical protein